MNLTKAIDMQKLQININELLSKLKFGRTRNEAILYLLAICSVISVIYFFLLINPCLQSFGDAVRDSNNVKEQIKQLKALMAKQPELMKSIESARQDMATYDKRLPSKYDVLQFVKEISQIADRSNIGIIEIMPVAEQERAVVDVRDKEKDRTPYKAVPIAVKAEGSYHSFGEFLANLQNEIRFMSVTDIHISDYQQNSRKNRISLLVNSYVLKKS